MADKPPEPETKPSPGLVRRTLDRGRARIRAARERWPLLDHAIRAYRHMEKVQGTMLAGAVTYFGYLSFFPILVIAFAVVTYVAYVVPDARNVLVTTLESVFPGLIGDGQGAVINIDQFDPRHAGAVGFVALLGLAYSGLGWISAARSGLQGVMCVPQEDRRNFLVAKVVDLVALAAIGTVLVVSVGLSSAVTNVTSDVLVLLRVDEIPGELEIALLKVVGVGLGVAASTLLFFTMFTLLPGGNLPRRAVLKGAFVAALGFEVLKLLASLLIGLAAQNPATAVLGTSLVLLVWINYFSRVIMVGGAWAYTCPEARRLREREGERTRSRDELVRRRRLRRERYGQRRRMEVEPPPLEPVAQRRVDRASAAAGLVSGATAAALLHAVRRRH
jgi:membrane protein